MGEFGMNADVNELPAWCSGCVGRWWFDVMWLRAAVARGGAAVVRGNGVLQTE
jgi:hypothetical protein